MSGSEREWARQLTGKWQTLLKRHVHQIDSTNSLDRRLHAVPPHLPTVDWYSYKQFDSCWGQSAVVRQLQLKQIEMKRRQWDWRPENVKELKTSGYTRRLTRQSWIRVKFSWNCMRAAVRLSLWGTGSTNEEEHNNTPTSQLMVY